MGSAACTALPGTLFSASLRAFSPSALGVPLLLLVSIRLGDRRIGVAGDRLLEAQDLETRAIGIGRQGLPMLPCRHTEERRCVGSIPTHRLCRWVSVTGW